MKSLTLTLVIIQITITYFSFAQICKPELIVYFDSDKDELYKSETEKIDKLISELKTDGEYTLEIYGYTDSDASDEYNLDLSDRRGEAIAKYLQNNYSGKFPSVEIYGKGETNPKYDNGIDEKKKLNRRVEVVLFPMHDGKIVITGDEGTKLEVGREYFGSCSICGSKPVMQEVRSNEQAQNLNITMGTVEGGSLVTGGMMKLTTDCQDTDPCISATIRIPTDEVNPYMEIWSSVDTIAGGRWTRGSLPMKFEEGFYVLEIPCFGSGGFNADVKYEQPELITPFAIKSDIVVSDSTLAQVGVTPKSNPDSVASLSYAYYLPPRKIRHVAVEGGIKFRFDKLVEPRHWRNDKSAIVLAQKDYTAEILLSDTTTRLKLPWNARREAALYIEVLDSAYTQLGKVKKDQRIFNFKKPVAEHLVQVCPKNGSQCTTVNRNGLRVRYSKRKKRLNIKVKRSAVKNLTE